MIISLSLKVYATSSSDTNSGSGVPEGISYSLSPRSCSPFGSHNWSAGEFPKLNLECSGPNRKEPNSPDYNLDSKGLRYCLIYECCVNRACLQSRSPIASPKLFRRRPSVNPPIPVPTPAVLIESVSSPTKPTQEIQGIEPQIRHSSVPPSLFVEHVSQLYDPDCKFCLKSTVDPQHSDCQKMQIFTRGNLKMVVL